MRNVALYGLLWVGAASGMASVAACGSSSNASGFGSGGADASFSGSGDDDGGGGTNGQGGSSGGGTLGSGSSSGDSGTTTTTPGACGGLQCKIASTCGNANGTTITGKVVDPAGANGLYNVLAYVPMYDPADPSSIPEGQGIQPIVGGVTFPSGVTCDSCSYLYTGNPIAIGTTGTDGTFTITNAPSGKNIPVVVQIGKWRTHVTVDTVTDCTAADAGTIKLPGSANGSDPIVSMPQIAISMGGSDSLECLPYRLGIDISEFTSGASSSGHIHVFTGGGEVQHGSPPDSSKNLWDSVDHLKKYDVTLFSCEGSETTNAKPANLEAYVNAGGRAFTSHFHYAWLSGPFQTTGYSGNADWGTHLATWNHNDQAADPEIVGGEISTTLNTPGGGTFVKGVALSEWLKTVGALGTDHVKSTEVAINTPSFDPKVTTANPISQPWVTFDKTSNYPTGYFSFNTPVDAPAAPDGGAPAYCGRVVFSGLHVGAAAMDTTEGAVMPSSSTCSPTPGHLSPQEKVLEFMLFDLSSCVTSDTAPPPVPVSTPPAPIR